MSTLFYIFVFFIVSTLYIYNIDARVNSSSYDFGYTTDIK